MLFDLVEDRFNVRIAGTAAVAVFVLAGCSAQGQVVWKPGFGRAAIWNDGNAEVSVYEARDVRDGVPRASRATLMVVAEDLNGEKLVKADKPEGAPGTIRVLKLNHVRSIQTGVSVYNQMLSVFLVADRLDPVKLTMASHDWCGNSFVEWRSDRKVLSVRSYFESVGDADLPLDPAGALFYDALPLALRGLDFERTREGRLRILETVFASAPAPPAAEDAVLRVAAAPGSLWRVTVERGRRRDVFDFETSFPHRLARWERPDGGLLTLIESRRFPYWQKNRPGDEKLLPPAPA
jgi:hypothetical protein